MENIHLIIVALNTALKYYFSIPDWNSRSLVLLLLSLFVCDIEKIIEGKAIQVYEEKRMTFTVYNSVQKDVVCLLMHVNWIWWVKGSQTQQRDLYQNSKRVNEDSWKPSMLPEAPQDLYWHPPPEGDQDAPS